MAEIIVKLVNGELAGKTMQSINKELNAAAQAARKAEIGTKEWVDAHARLDKAKALQADLKRQIDATSKASDTLKQQFFGILDQIPGFSTLTGALGKAKGGVGGLTSGFGLLKGAIIATGIGALVVLITSLVSWFSKTEKGANMVSGAFKAIGAAVDTLLSKIWNIGETLQEFLTDPVKFFKNLGNDIATAAREGYELVQVFDDIEDRQRDLAVKSKEQEIMVDKLLLQARNAGKTYNEKLAILEKADEITRASYQEQLALAKEYLDAVEREIAQAEKAGTMGDELADKRKEAKLAYLSLVQEEVSVEEKIANRRAQILDKQEKQNEKSVEKKAKLIEKAAEEELRVLRNLEDLRLQVLNEGADKEIAMIRAETKRKIDELKGSAEQMAEQRALLEELQEQQIFEIKDKYRKSDEEKAMQALIASEELLFQMETNLLNERLLSRELNEQQYLNLTSENLIAHHQSKLEIIKGFFGEESIDYQRAYGEFLNIQQAAADASVKITEKLTEDQRSAFNSSLTVFGNVFGTMAGMYEQGTQQWKDMATAQAIISTIQGAINAYSSTAAIPIIGPALAPIAAATAVAAGYAQVRKIQSTKAKSPIQKKELGGLLEGPRHSQGGIPIEAEGGEFIFSRKAVKALGVKELTRINDHFTRKFASGGPVNPFQNRGPVSSPAAATIAGSTDLSSGDKIDRLIFLIEQWPSKLKVINVATETEGVIKAVNKIRNDADV